MGMSDEMQIEAWRDKVGIEVGTNPDLLRKISRAAFELIKVIEREVSGIRDGDGCWHGSDVMGATLGEMAKMCHEWLRQSESEWLRRTGPDDLSWMGPCGDDSSPSW